MDWFKVKVRHCLYTDLNAKQFEAYVKLMALTAQIETIPTHEQMLKICHYKTLKKLQEHFNKRSIDLQEVLNKVLIDVQGVVASRQLSKERMQKYRANKDSVTKNIPVSLFRREDKIRVDKSIVDSITNTNISNSISNTANADFSESTKELLKQIYTKGFNIYSLLARFKKERKYALPEEVIIKVCTYYLNNKEKIRDEWAWFLVSATQCSMQHFANKNIKEAEGYKKESGLSIGEILKRANEKQ